MTKKEQAVKGVFLWVLFLVMAATILHFALPSLVAWRALIGFGLLLVIAALYGMDAWRHEIKERLLPMWWAVIVANLMASHLPVDVGGFLTLLFSQIVGIATAWAVLYSQAER